MVDTQKTFKLYRETKSQEARDCLILTYAPLVKQAVGRISMQVGAYVEYDDLVSYGIFGLIDAIDKFDESKGVKFETYASLRIRGSVIDNIRRLDWVPRTLRQKNKQFEQAYKAAESDLGREPTNEDLAIKLNILPEEVDDMFKKSNLMSLISLDDYLEQNQEGTLAAPQNDDRNPEACLERRELQDILTKAIDKLSDKEKLVITLYYYEDLTLKEISKVLSVSESRVSQLHSKAVFKLQNRLGSYKSVLFSR